MDDLPITPDSQFRRCADVRFRAMGDEGMVIRQRAGEVLVLNDTGIRILDLLGEQTPVANLIEQLAREYAVSADTLAADIPAYLEELRAAGVVEQVNEEST